MIIKSNDFFIYVSKSLEISNIIFDGRDLGTITGATYDSLTADANTVDSDGLAEKYPTSFILAN